MGRLRPVRLPGRSATDVTDRTTFGDLARVVTEHLNTAAWSQSSQARENPASTATQAQQLTHGLMRLAKVLSTYRADVSTTLSQPGRQQSSVPSSWPQAAREAQAAMYKVRK